MYSTTCRSYGSYLTNRILADVPTVIDVAGAFAIGQLSAAVEAVRSLTAYLAHVALRTGAFGGELARHVAPILTQQLSTSATVFVARRAIACAIH